MLSQTILKRYVPQFALLLSLVSLAATGCHSLQTTNPAGKAQLSQTAAANVPTFFVEVREGTQEKGRVKQLPLSEPLTVQQLLEKTGTLSQFNRMNITIERPVPGQRMPLKLEIPFDVGSHAVVAGNDYAIRPGDRVIIAEDSRTMVDRFLDQAFQMMGPLADM